MTHNVNPIHRHSFFETSYLLYQFVVPSFSSFLYALIILSFILLTSLTLSIMEIAQQLFIITFSL
jgi:hypothetical protein